MVCVYVVDKDGQPLTPMTRCGKVRIMLRQKRARVIKKDPFTIQLIGDHGTADKKENGGRQDVQICNCVYGREASVYNLRNKERTLGSHRTIQKVS